MMMNTLNNNKNMRQDVTLLNQVPISSFRARGGEECDGTPHQSNLLHSVVAESAAVNENDPYAYEMEYENENYIQELEEWIKQRICRYIPPAPRYLIINDMGSNKFQKNQHGTKCFYLIRPSK